MDDTRVLKQVADYLGHRNDNPHPDPDHYGNGEAAVREAIQELATLREQLAEILQFDDWMKHGTLR